MKKIIAGSIKIVIDIKLNANRPILFKICNISIDQEKLYPHKFHGKPPNIFARIKSEMDNPQERIKIDLKFKLSNGPKINTVSEKNKLKNSGIKIIPKGINILKLSSKVNELVIQ